MIYICRIATKFKYRIKMDKDICIQNQLNTVLASIFSDQTFRTRQKKEETEVEERKRIREELEQKQKQFRRDFEEKRMKYLQKMGINVVKIKQEKSDKVVYKIIPPTPPSPPKPQVLSPFDQFLRDNEICDNDLCRKIKEVYNNKVEEAKKSGGCNSCKMNAIKRSMTTYIEAYQKFLATRQKSSCTSESCALPSAAEKQ